MKRKKFRKSLVEVLCVLGLAGFSYTARMIQQPDPPKQTTVQKKTADSVKAVSKAERQYQTKSVNDATTSLADETYTGTMVLQVNGGKPDFTGKDLDTSKGAWQNYGNLDGLDRATQCDAMLNKSLMPTRERERLYINPTGWHNKRTGKGEDAWLYNQCHLIGYQLTGQNNNPKNLITGTRQLNTMGMLDYENRVANTLRSDPKCYIRYRVKPIFRRNELTARGVQMEAQSVGSNAVSYNVFVFNVQQGYQINYSDGTSEAVK